MTTVAQALASARCEDASLLLAHVLQRDRSWLIARSDDAIDPRVAVQFDELCARRAAGEPLAYILGSAGFYGREFLVNRHVLVPRPETEHLIDDAVAHLRGAASPRVLDVGTGSGAIAVTLAAELPGAHVDAVDISNDALEVARKNARRIGVAARTTFLHGDLLAPARGRRYDCIVANLPYVPTADIAPSPDPVSYEPRLALDGGADGLDCYRRLLTEAPAVLQPGAILLMEAAPPIMHGLESLARDAFRAAIVAVECDYGNRERYVKVQTRA